MSSSVKGITLNIFHHGCPAQLTEKFPGVSIKLISLKLVNKREGKNWYDLVLQIDAESKKQLGEFIKAFSEGKGVVSVEPLKKNLNKAIILAKVKTPLSSYEEVLNSGAMLFAPTEMKCGYDVHSIVTTDFKNIKSVLRELEEIGEIKVTKIGEVSPEIKKDFLTEKQENALKMAIAQNYYSWPRGVTLDSLAKKNKMKRRAYQEHLRKAESKILPLLIREYLSSSELNK
ncbi:MAG: helix-turn-helix domain-containing protein [Candidatus Diapherotrites archaeon]|nr:helix-turn-helix domain-containing protein [Candidatus Diapherotrites archaeon]